MKAIQIKETGSAEVLELQEQPIPTPKHDEVLIRMKAAGVNFIDIYIRSTGYRMKIDFPFIPGMEGAGIVEDIGPEVKKFKKGDHVAFAGHLGAYAEYTIKKENDLIPLPKEMSFEEGAAFPLQGITAHYLLHDYYQIKPKDFILVHAAAGGMGLLLVQWLKHLGANIIGTVSNEKKAELAKQAGAQYIINYSEQDFVVETKKITGGEGAAYIIDGVGKTTFTKDLEAARIHGWICLYGSASGPADPFPPNSLQSKSLTVSGGSLMNYFTPHEAFIKRAKAVIQGIQEGWLKLNIHHVFPLEQAKEAHQLLESRQSTGKIILKIN